MTGGTIGSGGRATGGSFGTGGASCVGAGICGRGPNGIYCAQSNGSSGFVSWKQWSYQYSDTDGWKTNPSYWATIQFPDVNGDGMADICGRAPNGIYCALADGNAAFAAATAWTSNAEYSDAAGWNASPSYWATIQFPDVNGDGKADVCGRAPDGIYCSISNGVNGFGPASQWNGDYSDTAYWNSSQSFWGTIQFPDINGDGKADICGRGSAGILCALSNGTNGFGSAMFWSSDFSDANTWGASPSYWATIQFPDINGDGKADVCGRQVDGVYCAVSNGTNGFGPGSATVWTANYSDVNGWGLSQSYWGSIQFPDINGDRRADVCGRGIAGVECSLSSGSGFGNPSNWAAAYSNAAGFNSDATRWGTVQFPDLDGDGMADVCGRSLAGVICGLSTGSGFATAQWTDQFSDGNGWQSDLSYGATLQTPNLNVPGCSPTMKKSTYLTPPHRLAPF